MEIIRRRAAVAAIASAALLVIAGCGKAGGGEHAAAGGPSRKLAPVAAAGTVSVITRNTSRVGGADSASDAAAVARVVYPGLTTQSRPAIVTVVQADDWYAALAASSLASAPTGAPLLYAEGSSLPEVSSESLLAMHPTGLAQLGGAQVLMIGTPATLPGGLTSRPLPVSTDPAVTAVAIERLLVLADGGSAPRQVIVVPAEAPRALQMPAAGLSAESGAPILYVTSARVPDATASALAGLSHPAIYLLDPSYAGPHTLAELRRLGHVTPIGPNAEEGTTPAANAIAVSRFTDGSFGWGIKEPGHGLVIANSTRPLDAPAAALLSATGNYGPLLLMETPGEIPSELATYLGDIEPAYTAAPQFRPVRGVYNHGWLIGDETAISSAAQAEIDSLLEISPRKQSSSGEEASASQTE